MALFSKPQNIFQTIGSDLAQRGQNIVSAVQSGANAYQQAQTGAMNPIQAGFRLAGTGIQTAGQVAGGALDILGAGVNSFAKPIANAVVGSPVGQAVTNNKTVQGLAMKAGNVADSIGKGYSNLQQKYPESTKTAAAVGNIASVLALNSAFKARPTTTPLPNEPTIQVGGKNLTIDDIHSPEFTQAFKNLPPAVQKTVSAFDQVQSADQAVAHAVAVGAPQEDVNDLKTAANSLKWDTLASQPQSVTLYRGQSPGDYGHGYFSVDKDFASGMGGPNKIVVQGSLPAGSKILDTTADTAGSNPDAMIVTDMLNSGKSLTDVYNYIWKNGYNAVMGIGDRLEKQVVVNPSLFDNFKVSNYMMSPASLQGGYIKNPFSNQTSDSGFLGNVKSTASTPVPVVSAKEAYNKALISKFRKP